MHFGERVSQLSVFPDLSFDFEVVGQEFGLNRSFGVGEIVVGESVVGADGIVVRPFLDQFPVALHVVSYPKSDGGVLNCLGAVIGNIDPDIDTVDAVVEILADNNLLYQVGGSGTHETGHQK